MGPPHTDLKPSLFRSRERDGPELQVVPSLSELQVVQVVPSLPEMVQRRRLSDLQMMKMVQIMKGFSGVSEFMNDVLGFDDDVLEDDLDFWVLMNIIANNL
ncbi:hypothetical protein HanXRQr2_Chr11g0477441 [Helianthus annuus]|uniref:Uncharacterized protein n=1 Tax=Helianthus annuus TaxID=4232 RepID=A0A9K3HMI0_HELAN|nr:hypothetical protein HanXRQr2_Chr11g0477441 [Helianthus annuus]KAJ0500609.1 hypothetical protein HanHA300_Chr11g0391371 [Helianthus annuus]KAJ0508192.1 hypothetical protein HanIR_Chr11g0514541 [Helianthus annuus]KAJ0516493.1 hypothetical protein HanHA89_Chr11g0414461 [Helianthus annuus]KAJ0628984.1 hypothetical protein HanIR_Chr00c31g0912031 [Helianthus annuus]